MSNMPLEELNVKKFQSLFSWNLLLMPNSLGVSKNVNQFQSLFSWNLLLMSI